MKTKPHCLITGATDGIGFATAVAMAQRGYSVWVHGRSQVKAEGAQKALQQLVASGTFAATWGDLSSMSSVRALAESVARQVPVLAVLINNAGVFETSRHVTPDGFERTMAVNHLAHALLTHVLLPNLQAAESARVVHVSSMAHMRGHIDFADFPSGERFDGYKAYASSKLANVLFAAEMARRSLGSKVTHYSLHPGVISTKLLRAGFDMSGASPESGAKTSVYCATAPGLETASGQYFSNEAKAPMSAEAQDASVRARFYQKTCEVLGIEQLPAPTSSHRTGSPT